MKRKLIFMAVMITLAATFYLTSCGQQSHDSHEHDQEQHAEEHSDNDEESASSHTESHEHDTHEHNSGDSKSMGEAMIWMPVGNATDAITGDFHFITGGIEDLSAEIITGADELSILKLSPSGNPASFVFHNKFGNVGISVTLKREGFEGEIKIVHHAKDVNTYEFVSINGSQMKLGRMVEGKETIFDEGSFDESNDWLTLKASAAGTHYKGYMGEKTTTHGHGEEMEAGYVGIMISGTGTVQIKQIEVTPIEAE